MKVCRLLSTAAAVVGYFFFLSPATTTANDLEATSCVCSIPETDVLFPASFTPTAFPTPQFIVAPPWSFSTCSLEEQTIETTRYINSISYLSAPLRFPVLDGMSTVVEEDALRWLLVDNPLLLVAGSQYDRNTVRTRYPLAVLWFGWFKGDNRYESLLSKWMTASNACTWNRITCENGQVFSLQLGSRLAPRGTISPDIALLSSLSNIDLDSTNMSGGLPSSLQAMTQLTSISISNDKTGQKDAYSSGQQQEQQLLLRGTIPSRRVSLYTELHGNNFSGQIDSSLGMLTQMEYLLLGENGLTGTIPSQWGHNLTALFHLDMAGNAFVRVASCVVGKPRTSHASGCFIYPARGHHSLQTGQLEECRQPQRFFPGYHQLDGNHATLSSVWDNQ